MGLEELLPSSIDDTIGIVKVQKIDLPSIRLGIVKKSIPDIIKPLSLIDNVKKIDIILLVSIPVSFDNIPDRILVFDPDRTKFISFPVMSDNDKRNMIVLDRTDFIRSKLIIINNSTIDMALNQAINHIYSIDFCTLGDENRGQIMINLGNIDPSVKPIGNIRVTSGRNPNTDVRRRRVG